MSKGKIVAKASAILVETYAEIRRMKNDLETILQNTNPSMKYVTEYSYNESGHPWVNRDYICYFEPKEPCELLKQDEQLYFGIQILLYEHDLTRRMHKTLQEPEIWAWMLESSGVDKCTYSDLYWFLTYKDCFTDENLKAIGKVYKYEERREENWIGWFVGKNLVEIESAEVLKGSLVDPLFDPYHRYKHI